jgi:hypothetical protein
VKWEGPIDLTADEIGVEPEAARVKRPRERAAEWLKDELANGPRKAAELIAEAKRRGIPEKTLYRAKKMIRAGGEYRWKGELREWYWQDSTLRNVNSGTAAVSGVTDPGRPPQPASATPAAENMPLEGVETTEVKNE